MPASRDAAVPHRTDRLPASRSAFPLAHEKWVGSLANLQNQVQTGFLTTLPVDNTVVTARSHGRLLALLSSLRESRNSRCQQGMRGR